MKYFYLVPESSVEKPPEADAWYKSALEKARAIAQSMKEGGGVPPATTTATISQPDVKPKVEPEVKPAEKEVKAEPAVEAKDEYGSGSTGPSEVAPAPGPSPSVAAPSKKNFTLHIS